VRHDVQVRRTGRQLARARDTHMTLTLLGNTLLRAAITRNLVSFPSQVRPFMKRTSGDLQERIVQLYFVRGWSVRNICDRYGLSKAMAHKLLVEWRVRAVESGHIQEIEPGILAAMVQETRSEEVNIPKAPVYAPVQSETPDAVPGLHEFDFGNLSGLPIRFVEHPNTLSAGRGV
jgi:transposase-like protein